MKESFVLYTRYKDQLSGLSREQKGLLLESIFLYVLGEELPEMDALTSLAFSVVRFDLDKDAAKYAERCEKNRRNVEKRWNDTNVYERIRTHTKDTDNDYDSDNDIQKKNIKKKSGRKNAFNNFTERVYDFGELEKALRG